MRILAINDDGYQSAAYRALIRELRSTFDLLCIAPESQRSWIGKAFTSGKELAVTKIDMDDGHSLHHCPGTPADCTQIGLHHLIDPSEIGAVISGMNYGRNDGVSRILSSGTLGAAFEGALSGRPSFAISIASTYTIVDKYDLYSDENIDLFSVHAKIAADIVKKFLHQRWEGFNLISCNIPLASTESTPIVITKPSLNGLGSVFAKTENGFKFQSPKKIWDDDVMTDEHAIAKGMISVTPISFEFSPPASVASAQKMLSAGYSTSGTKLPK